MYVNHNELGGQGIKEKKIDSFYNNYRSSWAFVSHYSGLDINSVFYKHTNQNTNDVRYYMEKQKGLISVEDVCSKAYYKLHNRLNDTDEPVWDENIKKDSFRYGSVLSNETREQAKSPDGQDKLHLRYRVLSKLLEFLEFFDTNHKHSKYFSCFNSEDSGYYSRVVVHLADLVSCLSGGGYIDTEGVIAACEDYIDHSAGLFAKIGINIAGGADRYKKVKELRNYLLFLAQHPDGYAWSYGITRAGYDNKEDDKRFYPLKDKLYENKEVSDLFNVQYVEAADKTLKEFEEPSHDPKNFESLAEKYKDLKSMREYADLLLSGGNPRLFEGRRYRRDSAGFTHIASLIEIMEIYNDKDFWIDLARGTDFSAKQIRDGTMKEVLPNILAFNEEGINKKSIKKLVKGTIIRNLNETN